MTRSRSRPATAAWQTACWLARKAANPNTEARSSGRDLDWRVVVKVVPEFKGNAEGAGLAGFVGWLGSVGSHTSSCGWEDWTVEVCAIPGPRIRTWGTHRCWDWGDR